MWRGNVYLFDARMDENNPLFEVFDTNFHSQAQNMADNKLVQLDEDAVVKHEKTHNAAKADTHYHKDKWEDISHAGADYEWIENTNQRAQ